MATNTDRIEKTTVLKASREKVWRARREVFTGDFPVSTLVQVAALASPDIKVEIEAIAHLGAGVR